MKFFMGLLAFISLGNLFCAEASPYETSYSVREKRLCIVIPAFNEEKRIGGMLDQYRDYFENQSGVELLVVINGCTDGTKAVVQDRMPGTRITCIQLDKAGKGRAVKQGFLEALDHGVPFDYIGFVDADGATGPEAFNELVQALQTRPDIDGVIASRYMEGSLSTERPFIKKWGQKLCFLPLVKCLFGLDYQDTQCGAKLFKKEVLDSVAHLMSEPGWSFDVELLYLAQKAGFILAEQPTSWEDQEGSHLNSCSNGIPMLCSLCLMRAGFCCK